MIRLILKSLFDSITHFLMLMIVLSIGTIYFFLDTTAGLQTGLSFITAVVPGQFHYGKVQGSLLSEIEVENFSYRHAKDFVNFSSLHGRLNVDALLREALVINELVVNNLKIDLHSNKKPSHFEPDDLRFLTYLFAYHVTLENFIIKNNDTLLIQCDNLQLQKMGNEIDFNGDTLRGKVAGFVTLTWDRHFAWNAAVSAKEINPGLLWQDWPGNISFDLASQGTLQSRHPMMQASLNHLTGTLRAQPVTGFVEAVYGNNTLHIKNSFLKYANADLQLSGQMNRSWDIAWNLHLPMIAMVLPHAQGQLTATGKISGLHESPTLMATVDGRDLAYLSQKIGSLKSAIDLAFFANHSFDLKLDAISDTGVSIPALQIALQKIHIAAKGDLTKKIIYSGALVSGKGTLNVSGTTDLSHPGFTTTARVQGDQIQVINTSEYKITASPDLTINYANTKFALSGSLYIPEAQITPKDYSKTVSLPDEVVFVDALPVKNSLSTPTYLPNMQITLRLGEHIFVKYQNLQTSLEGNLTITTSDNRYPTATGQLIARNGKYQAYGQSLTIQEGNLIYTGNLLTNPGLNIKATRTIDTVSTTTDSNAKQTAGNPNAAADYGYVEKQKITVGVKISGNLSNPRMMLFSDPSNLTQSNILSYLVLGIPDVQASSSTKQALLNAASALSMSQTGSNSRLNQITSKVQNTLGLAELNVQSVQRFDPTSGNVIGTTSLVVGKQIADNLYLHYSIGLFTPVSIVGLRYQFNKHWAIQSETSSLDKGADILYSIERD